MMFKKVYSKILLIGVIILGLISFLPKVGLAALVPCGPGIGARGDTGFDDVLGYIPCQLCHIFVLLDNIIRFILQKLVPMIAVLMFIVSGVTLFTSAGDPGKAKKAKDLLTSVVIGLLIIYGAYLIINIVLTAIGVAEWTGLKSWFNYPCP